MASLFPALDLSARDRESSKDATALASLVLAGSSFAVARVRAAGWLALTLLAAALKACFVVWTFMHLVEERATSRFAVLVGLSSIAVLVVLSFVARR